MRDYTEVETQDELDALLARVGYFHDAMAKEAHLMRRGHVDADHSTAVSHRLDARVLVQSQWSPFAIEFLFVDVERFEAARDGERSVGPGTIVRRKSPTDEVRISLGFPGGMFVVAQRLFVRDRPDWLGPTPRFGNEVPRPGAVPASSVAEGWRQCGACADAFEAPSGDPYARCPGCGAMTELAEPRA
jgi:hypothetical protein